MADPSRSDEPARDPDDAEQAPTAAPPGSGIINNSRSGQAVSQNPVTRVGRDAGDVLADEVREERDAARD